MAISNITSKKDLAIILSAIKGFEEPKAEWEQYMTPSEIASEMIWTAFMDENIKGKKVADFGCGTGIFSFGAALIGAEKVTGYDIDNKAIVIAEKNKKIIEKTNIPLSKIEFIQKDIKDIDEKFDTIIMNPPFGVQEKGADAVFLKKAFEKSDVIYSMHKFGTEEFLEKFAKENNFKPLRLTEKTLKLKPSMEFHEELKHSVKVMLWKFSRK